MLHQQAAVFPGQKVPLFVKNPFHLFRVRLRPAQSGKRAVPPLRGAGGVVLHALDGGLRQLQGAAAGVPVGSRQLLQPAKAPRLVGPPRKHIGAVGGVRLEIGRKALKLLLREGIGVQIRRLREIEQLAGTLEGRAELQPEGDGAAVVVDHGVRAADHAKRVVLLGAASLQNHGSHGVEAAAACQQEQRAVHMDPVILFVKESGLRRGQVLEHELPFGAGFQPRHIALDRLQGQRPAEGVRFQPGILLQKRDPTRPIQKNRVIAHHFLPNSISANCAANVGSFSISSRYKKAST